MKHKPDHLCAFRGCFAERVWNAQRGCYNSRYCTVHARVDRREQRDPVTYLRHPDTRRVLALVQSNETHEFIALLRLCGYLPASAEDYDAQQQRQTARNKQVQR